MKRFVLKTWNCFGAAQTAMAFLRWRGPPDAHRFELPEVTHSLQEADVLCMQELFLSDAESFFDRLSHGHKRRDANASTLWPLTFGGSGLGIASRMPIVEHLVCAFGRPQIGTERFARKGMLYARLGLPGGGGLELDVVTTHLQSGYGAAPMRVRQQQLEQLRRLIDERGSATRDFVVCGDLNIDGLSPARAEGEYAALRRTLSDFDDLGAEGDHATFHPDPEVNELAHRFESNSPRQRIDYVLFRASGERRLRPIECRLVLHQPFFPTGKGRTFASDHFALRVEFETVVAAREDLDRL